jgi:hypothetical protein
VLKWCQERREKNLASLYTLQPVKPTTSDARENRERRNYLLHCQENKIVFSSGREVEEKPRRSRS